MKKSPKEILEEFWGFNEFRGSQELIINAILEGNDVLALLPTGGGKSICFQIPALAKEGICIVISPLVALIQNQVDNLRQKGIKAIALTGGIPVNEVHQLLDNCTFGNYKFLYLSPERLQQDIVKERIKRMKVNLIAIDEAHCISQWGHDFRPAYLECAAIRTILPQVPIIALTATATKQVISDIVTHLNFNNPHVFKDSFSRKNIAFKIFSENDKRYRLKMLCKNLKQSAIVYVRTRRLTQEIAQYLIKEGLTATYYHGGVSKQEKEKKMQLWLKDEVKIMVATNAFGMGIDKPDVSLVVHYQIPDCLENYIQEAGRAGRNGQISEAVLITNKVDEELVQNQFLGILPNIDYIKQIYKKLNNYFQIAYNEGKDEIHQLNFNAFCSTYKLNTILTYNTLQILDQNSVIALNESFTKRSEVQFLASKNQLFNYLDSQPKLAHIIQTLLRTYGGVFDFTTKINSHLIAKKSNVSEAKVHETLEQLKKDEIINYTAQHSDLEITFLVPREDNTTINQFAHQVKALQTVKKDNLNKMLSYINNNKVCRSKQLLHYFGEYTSDTCGICDICITKNTQENTETVSNGILKILESSSSTSRQLIELLSFSDTIVLETIQQLLEEEIIKINSKNEYELYKIR